MYVSAPLLNSDQLLSHCQLQALPQEKKIRSILGSEVHVCPREWSIWVWFYFIFFPFGGYKRVHNILFRLSLILTPNMCSNMVSGYNFYCIVGQTVCVCVCVGVSEWERQEERKWFFFILLGYFVFVSENEGKKETGQWDRKERGKWENRLQLSIREVIGQRRLHYLLFRRAHSLYSQEATV